MSVLNKYNKGKMFGYQTPKTHKYVSLSDMVKQYGINETHQVNAIYVNTKSRFGEAGILVTNNELVNLPNHLTPTIKDMIVDDEIVDMANNNQLGFKIYSYQGRNGEGYSVNWVDLRNTLQ